ncbi:MAG: GNAT family N-acetyltransferase [Dehalococcoidia bacterium]|nr:GNAT family N-acetyltransferase [Dehalococcoidia bacterium]
MKITDVNAINEDVPENPATQVIIRNALPEELNAVSRLIRSAYLEYQPLVPSGAWKDYMRDITDVRSRLGVSVLIVAKLERRLAGTVTLYLNGSQSGEGWPDGWAGIRLLAVHPKERGRGIGRLLVEECIRRCRQSGLCLKCHSESRCFGMKHRKNEESPAPTQ